MELALVVVVVAMVPWRGNLHAAGAAMFAGMLVLVAGAEPHMTHCCFGGCSDFELANPYLWKQVGVTVALGWAYLGWRRARPPAVHALRRAMFVTTGMTLVATVGSWDARGAAALQLCGIELWGSAVVTACLVLERRLARPALPRAIVC